MVKTKGFKMLTLQIDNQVIEKISVQGFKRFNRTHTQMKQGSMKMSCNEDTNENFLAIL